MDLGLAVVESGDELVRAFAQRGAAAAAGEHGKLWQKFPLDSVQGPKSGNVGPAPFGTLLFAQGFAQPGTELEPVVLAVLGELCERGVDPVATVLAGAEFTDAANAQAGNELGAAEAGAPGLAV